MADTTSKLTPSGARRLGDKYQDIVAMDLLIDWLEHENRYRWIKVEADQAGFLDDVVALTSDGRLLATQVKYSTDPDDKADPWTWNDLLDRDSTKAKSQSLLQKWAASLPKLRAIGPLQEAALVSNRRGSVELQQASLAGNSLIIDFDAIADSRVRLEITTQLGGETAVQEFFAAFQFKLNQPNLRELEGALKKRFERIGGTDTGWHQLLENLDQWVYFRNEPAPNGEITLAHVKEAALWERSTGALSAIPVTARSLVDLPMVGRENDIEWLTTSANDRLLIGTPGCGKTFLLSKFATSGSRYFVVDDDRLRVTTALRAQRPDVVIVDDAHLKTELVKELRQIRQEIAIKFDIVAAAWPGDAHVVQEALGIGEGQCHDLPLLTRDEIVAVVRACGLGGPDRLVQEIVVQAEGRPGLAVTLTQLCLEGNVQEVTLGRALWRSIRTFIEPRLGEVAADILAMFAVGGHAGMRMEDVADLTGIPLLDVRRKITGLAAGGVVVVTGSDRLSVRPPELRYALIRDVFFEGPARISIGPYLEVVPDIEEAVSTLLHVRLRGGAVPDKEVLLPLVEMLRSPDIWRLYANIGPEQATSLLQLHPEIAPVIAVPALMNAPDKALPLLFDSAANDRRPLNSSPDHPFRRIEDWILSFNPGPVSRRQTLIRAVQGWLRGQGDWLTASHALAYALSPRLEQFATTPGSGDNWILRRTVLPEQDLTAMGALWAEVRDIIAVADQLDWNELISAVSDWVYPQKIYIDECSPAAYNIMRAQAAVMVIDLAGLAKDHPAVLQRLQSLRETLQLQAEPSPDSEFALLYPPHPRGDWHSAREEQRRAVAALAQTWKDMPPSNAAARLAHYSHEASLAGSRTSGWTAYLCQEIAEQVACPIDWAYAFAGSNAPPILTAEFVQLAVSRNDDGWQEVLSFCLRDETLRHFALILILGLPEPSDEMMEEALPHLAQYQDLVETSCLRNEVTAGTLIRLLHHEDVSVRTAAAVGLWCANPQGSIPESLWECWHDAVMDIPVIVGSHNDYWLGQILAHDRLLARDWIQARLEADTRFHPPITDNLQGAFNVLSDEDRIHLLSCLQVKVGTDEMIMALVGERPEVYRALLAIGGLKDYHLVPLGQTQLMSAYQAERQPSYSASVWNEMTVLALDACYTPVEVAEALEPKRWTWSGDVSVMYQSRLQHFIELENHTDERVREVAKVGQDHASRRRDAELVSEHHHAIYGEWDS